MNGLAFLIPVALGLGLLGLLAFFFVYAVAFTWAFDRVFGLPASASAGQDPVSR